MSEQVIRVAPRCFMSDCREPANSTGACEHHYEMLVEKGFLDNRNQSRDGKCILDGCETKIKAKKLCEKHYTRLKRRAKIYAEGGMIV